MKPVTNKSRANATPPSENLAAADQTTKTTLADIRAWIVSADAKLETAYDAAEKGEPVDVLLDHICHSVMLEPLRIIHREDLTQADARRLYAALFPVLACIQGAMELAPDSVLRHTLEIAFELLDSAQTALDPVNEAVRSLPAGGVERDFLDGRDLAVSMLVEADEVQAKNPDIAYYKRAYRDGKEQRRFTRQYLDRLLDEPELLDGFNAVLSAKLADQCSAAASHYAVSMAEYEAGEIGADGTQPLDDDAPEASTPLPSAAPADQVQAVEHEWNPYHLMLQAKDVAEAAALHDEGTDAMWGVHSLIEKALGKVSQAVEQEQTDSQDFLNKASDELACTLAVLNAVNNDGLDNSLLYASASLMRTAKGQIDTEIDRLVRACSERVGLA